MPIEKMCKYMKRNFDAASEKDRVVEIYNKKAITEVFGRDVERAAGELGIPGIKKVEVARIYRFCGMGDISTLKKIAEDILVDPVTEVYSIESEVGVEQKTGWIVEVWLKRGVTDTVSETILSAMHNAGMETLGVSVASGKRYYIKGTVSRKNVTVISEKILANTLIHDYHVEG